MPSQCRHDQLPDRYRPTGESVSLRETDVGFDVREEGMSITLDELTTEVLCESRDGEELVVTGSLPSIKRKLARLGYWVVPAKAA